MLQPPPPILLCRYDASLLLFVVDVPKLAPDPPQYTKYLTNILLPLSFGVKLVSNPTSTVEL